MDTSIRRCLQRAVCCLSERDVTDSLRSVSVGQHAQSLIQLAFGAKAFATDNSEFLVLENEHSISTVSRSHHHRIHHISHKSPKFISGFSVSKLGYHHHDIVCQSQSSGP